MDKAHDNGSSPHPACIGGVNPVPVPHCSECGGDMMGYAHPLNRRALVWECRCCGATYVYDDEYNLRSLPLDYAQTGREEADAQEASGEEPAP